MMPINVEVNRSKEGAAPAPQEACPRKGSVPSIGSTETEWLRFAAQAVEFF
jgi:hypothetical protein